MTRRILVVMGGTPYASIAIRHAVELARRHEASVTGIAVLDREAEHVARLGVREVEKLIDTNVSELQAAATSADVTLRIMREKGEPVQAICMASRYHDLTVLGLRGLFEYGVVAEPKEAVSRLIQSGVRPIFAVSKEYTEIRRILVAYGGSMESANAMKSMIQLRLWPDAVTSLVYFTSGDEEAAAYEPLLTEAAAYCADWGVDLQAKAQVGGAKDHLLSYARRCKSDLIVMGDSAESLLTRRLFGDTTLDVLRKADRSLFISH